MHYKDYFWKYGKPKGLSLLQEQEVVKSPVSYAISSDPYFKRISIEKYEKGIFKEVVYDSIFLDFRKLNPREQTAWERKLLNETKNSQENLLRDRENRAILLEKLRFKEGLCVECMIHSVHGILAATHRMYYQALNDPFDGVVLFDKENRPVMFKQYAIDEQSGEFLELLREEWNMGKENLYQTP